jgi:hypothetical protein
MGLTVDSPIPPEALDRITSAVGMKSARSIVLGERPAAGSTPPGD